MLIVSFLAAWPSFSRPRCHVNMMDASSAEIDSGSLGEHEDSVHCVLSLGARWIEPHQPPVSTLTKLDERKVPSMGRKMTA